MHVRDIANIEGQQPHIPGAEIVENLTVLMFNVYDHKVFVMSGPPKWRISIHMHVWYQIKYIIQNICYFLISHFDIS